MAEDKDKGKCRYVTCEKHAYDPETRHIRMLPVTKTFIAAGTIATVYRCPACGYVEFYDDTFPHTKIAIEEKKE